jgi:hypothetical protein
MRADNLLTLQTLPSMLRPILVVHSSEERDYRHYNPGIKVLPTEVKGIGKTRAFICRHAVRKGYPVVAMLDDDINGWIYKAKLDKFGGIRIATDAERDERWRKAIARANRLVWQGEGFACSFTYRFALAGPTNPNKMKLRVGLVNECMLMNRVAMKMAPFTLETCEDIESTLAWLSCGVTAGQDLRLGHTSPKTALTAERGGCGEYREQHEGFHLRNHRKLWKMFPQFVAEPRDEGKRRSDGMVMLKTRVGYAKAAKAGGLI